MKSTKIMLAVLAFSAMVLPVTSGTVKINISGAGDPTTTFTVNQNPTPQASELGYWFGVQADATTNGTPTPDYYYFYSVADGGGLSDNYFYNMFGSALYSGPETSPSFMLGTSTFLNGTTGNTDRVSITGVPETSTWIMMLAGLASLSFAKYRRTQSAKVRVSQS